MNQSKIDMKEIWKKRLCALIYGLIYPAFLGNMIYDLILMKRSFSNDAFNFPDYYTCLVIVLFSAIDYMHLNGDMNDVVPFQRRSLIYIICDALMPFMLFGAFVSIKEESYLIGSILFGLVPCLLLFYKLRNKPSRNIFFFYAGLSALIGLILAFYKFAYTKELILSLVICSLITYSTYIVFIYPNKPRTFDIDFIKNNPNVDY